MSEISNQDENGAKGKEKNPMVQRILLEVQRREPNSVSIHHRIFQRLFFFDRSKNWSWIIVHVVIQSKV